MFTSTKSCSVHSSSASAIQRLITFALISTILLAHGVVFVNAAPTKLSVTPGWDAFGPGSGSVTYNLVAGPRRQRKLQITYELKGAKPLQKYDLALGIFYPPNTTGVGLKFFGVPRFLRETHTREDVTKTIDGFIVGKFNTDRFGNGQTHVDLDLSTVPAGAYDVQFTWTQLSDLRCHYRTGTKFGQDFAKIVLQ
jgi:hypothetical protein